MKLKTLMHLSVISSLVCALSISASIARAATPSTNASAFSQLEKAHIMLAQTQPMVALTGTFVAAEQPTSGIARIINENGQRYLVLDSGFKTSSQGPDLHVVLDPTDKPPMQYKDLTRYVNLGRLQKYTGEQRYPIPATIDLSKFKSVAIWCRMANATFGYAPLRPARNASAR